MNEQAPEPKKSKHLQVWLCISCLRYAEYPGNCQFCGMVILSKPIRIEIAILQTLSDLLFTMRGTEDKKKK